MRVARTFATSSTVVESQSSTLSVVTLDMVQPVDCATGVVLLNPMVEPSWFNAPVAFTSAQDTFPVVVRLSSLKLNW